MDASLLQPGFSTEVRDGFYARFDWDGTLQHFGCYLQGRPVGPMLTLEAAKRTAHVEKSLGCFPPDGPSLRDFEDDDEFSTPDEERSEEEEFQEWVSDWIQEIYREHERRQAGTLTCSFCGKTREQVRKLIAGPTVYICDECVDLCQEILAEERAAPGPSDP